jgi:hypothetical protein
MPEYRIYLVTEDNHIAAAPIRFVCDDDVAAVQHSEDVRNRNGVMQLWQGRRLVTRLESNVAV